MRKRRRCLCEREAAVYRQVQDSRLDGAPQIGAHAAIDLAHVLGRTRAEGDADVVDALQRVQVVVEFALCTAQPAGVDDAPERACGLQT